MWSSCLNTLPMVKNQLHWYLLNLEKSLPTINCSSMGKMHCIIRINEIHQYYNITSHKKVFSMKTSTCRDGTLKNQPNKIGTTPQYFYTIPTSCAILPTMHCVCYLCAQKGCLGHGSLWNEQYWVCSARCCVWRVRCVVGGCNFVTVECGRHG